MNSLPLPGSLKTEECRRSPNEKEKQTNMSLFVFQNNNFFSKHPFRNHNLRIAPQNN
jgi:hypothetical protein